MQLDRIQLFVSPKGREPQEPTVRSPSGSDFDASSAVLRFLVDPRKPGEAHSVPATVSATSTLCAGVRGCGSEHALCVKELGHATRSGSWNTASTAASTTFVHPTLADIHCYWRQPTADKPDIPAGAAARPASPQWSRISPSRGASPSLLTSSKRRATLDASEAPSPPSAARLQRSPSHPLQFLQSWAGEGTRLATASVRCGIDTFDKTGNRSRASGYAASGVSAPLRQREGALLRLKAGGSTPPVHNSELSTPLQLYQELSSQASSQENASRQTRADQCSRSNKGRLSYFRRSTAGQRQIPIKCRQTLSAKKASLEPRPRSAFQALASLKSVGGGTVRCTDGRPQSHPSPVEHTLLKLRVNSKVIRRPFLHSDSPSLGRQGGCLSSLSPGSPCFRDSVSEPIVSTEDLSQLLDDTASQSMLNRKLLAAPCNLLPFQSSMLHTFLTVWRQITSERQLMRRLACDAQRHRDLRIARQAFLGLRMHAHTTMQLRLKGDICRLQAIAYNAQKHFFAWLRLHYAGSARKAFLQTFGLRAFRNGVEEGYKLRAIAEAVYCRFLKIRTLRAFAQFRLLQEQAQAAEAVATRRYTRSLLRKGMKGWRKWHAYIGACSKLLMVASQLNASRHQDTLLTVLRAWREAAIRSETEYSRLVALALPRRVKAAFRKWLRWARLSSWLREKRRLDAQSQTAELFRRWRSLSQESTTAGKTIQRDISFSLNEKRKIRLAAAVRSWRALASGRASARRAYNACLTERKRKLFTHLREVAFLWGVQRDLAREKALRYAQNVLLYWHRLTRRRKRERFVLRCLVTSRDEKVLTAAWRDWKRAATFNRLATDFGDRRIAVRAFNSWKLLSAQRRRLQKSSAYFVARAAANWQRQRFEQWAALVRFRRSAKFQVFSLWRQAARIRRHHRAVAAHVAARKDRNTLGTLWRAWREQLAEAEQVRTFQLRQQGRKVLGALIAYFEYREAKRARDEDILSAWAKATTEKLLHVWSEAAHYRWRLRTAYNQVVSLRRHSVLLSFFTVWLHETEFALSCGGTMTSGGGCAPASPTGATQTSGFWTADRPALSEMTESGVAVEDAVQARLKKHLSNAPTTSIWNHRKESDAAQVAASPAASSGENSTDTSRPSWSPTLERASWGSSPIRVQTLRPFTGLKTHDLAGPERESRKGGQASSLQLTPFRKRQSGSLLQAFAAWRRLAEQSRDASELRRSGDERERTETRHRTKQRVPFIRRASDPHWLETDAARLAYKKAHCFRVVKVQQRGFRTWRAFMSTKHCIVTRLQDEFRAVRAMRKWKAAFARRKTLHALAHVQCHYLQDIEHPKPSRGYPSE